VLPEVDPPDVLADHDDVDTVDRLRAQGPCPSECSQRLHRCQLAVEVESLSQVVDEASAAGAAQECAPIGKGLFTETHDVRGKLAARRPLRCEANRPAGSQLETLPRHFLHGLEHVEGGTDHLGTDTLTRQDTDDKGSLALLRQLPVANRAARESEARCASTHR
jgi:hypothetical protein